MRTSRFEKVLAVAIAAAMLPGCGGEESEGVVPTAEQSFSFVQEIRIAAAPGLKAVALGDLNGDDRTDLAMADDGGLSVMLQTAGGNFSAASAYVAGEGSAALLLADLDEDGDLDVAVCNSVSATVSILLNDGAGAFADATNISVGLNPVHLTAADLSGDEHLDLVVANKSNDSVSVLLGNAKGSFATPVSLTVGSKPTGVAVADLNGDTLPDLVVSNESSADLTVLINQGEGAYAAGVSVATETSPYSVLLADVDGDDVIDALTLDRGADTVALLLGDGSGSFDTTTPQSWATGAGPNAFTRLDLTENGHADIITVNSEGDSVTVLEGTEGTAFTRLLDTKVGDKPRDIAWAQIDDNESADLAVAIEGEPAVLLLLGAGASPTKPPALEITTTTLPAGVLSVPYGATITTSGAITLLTLKVSSGPALASNGAAVELSGLPLEAGSFAFELNVEDSATPPNTDTQSFSLFINATPPGPNSKFVLSATLPVGKEPQAIEASDLNGDGSVNVHDLLLVIAAWGDCETCPEDLNADGHVNVHDILLLIGDWGDCL